jgi:peptidoglycan/xylan/chitin deacetylase (PgdA/CDA1 family)
MTALRRLGLARRLAGRRSRALVLVYHRVGERGLDPWRLTVDPEIFAGQMETLARDWSPLSLGELVEGLGRRRLPERAIAVTFDDGYDDNLELAAPVLREHGIPATFFVATDLIDTGASPWWDELVALLLEPAELPPTLALSSGRRWKVPPLPSGAQRPSATDRPPWEAEPGTRMRLFYEVWLVLRALDAPTRDAALDEIADWASAQRPAGRVLLTWEQVCELAALPGFTLGAHTRTHPDLSTCAPEGARAEIAGGADRLHARAGIEPEQFAYPYGAWTASVARLVAELGFRAAYTTDGKAVSWGSSPHALPRVPAESQTPDVFARLLADIWGR